MNKYEGWYYLHVNGDLIYKRELGGTAADIRESDLAIGLWPCDRTSRLSAWTMLVESLAAGANSERVSELAAHFNADEEDAKIYADKIGVILTVDGDKVCCTRHDFVNLQVSKAGFGDTSLEAMADLCRNLGYKPSKMWGSSFASLL